MWKKKILSTYMWPFFSNIWYLVDASVYRSIFNYTHSMYISLPLYDNESISPNFEHFKSNVLTVLCDFLFIIRFFVHSFICLCVFLWHGRAINLVSNVISGTEVWDGYGIYISNLVSTVISGTEVWDGYGIYISNLASTVISGTEIWDGYGIYISNLASTVISGTEVWDGYGIYISNLASTVISGTEVDRKSVV